MSPRWRNSTETRDRYTLRIPRTLAFAADGGRSHAVYAFQTPITASCTVTALHSA